MGIIVKYIRVILNIIIPILIIFLICAFGPRLLGFFMPFVIGGLISLIANPLVRFLENKLKIVRKHGSAIIVIFVLALIILSGYFLIAKIVIESGKFIKDLPAIYEVVSLEITNNLAKFSRVYEILPEGFQNMLNNFYQNTSVYLGDVVQKVGMPTFQVAGNVAKMIPTILINVIFTILSSYFFIAHRDNILKVSEKILPESMLKKIRFMNQQIKHMAGIYLLAQFKIMIVVAAILFVGFVILNVNYALLFALLIAFLDFLPLFGTGTALIPWAIMKLLSGEYYIGVGLIIVYVATQGTRQLIQPKIVGDTMGLNPLLTLLMLYIGYKFSGISGMILSVPVGLLVIEFYKFGAFDSLFKNLKILVSDINNFRKGK